jgi:Holliday junction DNA helicase RuvA
MIARLSGRVVEKFAGSVIVDVAGVGYEVRLPDMDFERALLGDEVVLHTYHHIREQSQELFGFFGLSAKKLFELLISVNGIGPKAGLAILSRGESEDVRNAIANADVKFISSANGVGKKSAERAIIDLQDKVGAPVVYDISARKAEQTKLPKVQDDAVDALITLGYSLQDAVDALVDIDESLGADERIKLALKSKGI